MINVKINYKILNCSYNTTKIKLTPEFRVCACFFFNGGQGTNYDIKFLPHRQGWRRVTLSPNDTKMQI